MSNVALPCSAILISMNSGELPLKTRRYVMVASSGAARQGGTRANAARNKSRSFCRRGFLVIARLTCANPLFGCASRAAEFRERAFRRALEPTQRQGAPDIEQPGHGTAPRPAHLRHPQARGFRSCPA